MSCPGLPRYTPLQTRKPLNRGKSTLKRTRLKPISDRRRATLPLRAQVRAFVLARDGYRCRAALPGCSVAATDVHELRRRSQRKGAELDPDNCVALCRPCHEFVTGNPAAARSLGLHLFRGDTRTAA